MSYGSYPFHQASQFTAGSRRRTPHRPSSSRKSPPMMMKEEELTVVPAVPNTPSSPRRSSEEEREAAMSFELDDDLVFCPDLCSDDEIDSASDHSSTSSGSPDSSPLQQPVTPYPAAAYSQIGPFPPQSFNHKFAANSARQHKAIPIVNPSTGMRVPSPSSPPARQLARRVW